MELILKRDEHDSYTEGKLYVYGVFICDTLEDQYRDLSKEQKVPGATAIPYGRYQVKMLPSPKRGGMLVPWILDVPRFLAIQMHSGNDIEDTDGCPLLGHRVGPGLIDHSAKTRDRFYELLNNTKEDIWLTIV